MAYGSDLADIYRGLANVIGTILRTRPGAIASGRGRWG